MRQALVLISGCALVFFTSLLEKLMPGSTALYDPSEDWPDDGGAATGGTPDRDAEIYRGWCRRSGCIPSMHGRLDFDEWASNVDVFLYVRRGFPVHDHPDETQCLGDRPI